MWQSFLDGTLALKSAAFNAALHPRHPKGDKRGGKFAPKPGALATAGGQARFNPKRVETDLGADPLHSPMFERAHSVMVLFNPKTQETLFGIGVLNSEHGDARTVHYVHNDVLRAAKPQILGDDEKAVASRMDAKIDNWVRGTFVSTGGAWRLEMNTSYAAGTRFDRATNRWEEHPEESVMNISDALAALRAQGFPKDVPVEIWKGIPGRRGSEIIRTTLAEKAFDEGKHPRHPKGSDKGGEFVPKGNTEILSLAAAIDKHARERASRIPLLAELPFIDASVAPGIAGEKQVAQGWDADFQGSHCYANSLSRAVANGEMLMVGFALPREQLEASRDFDWNKYWAINLTGITHAWNMDARGRIVDSTLGSREAKDWIYFGVPIRVAAGMTDRDVEILAHQATDRLFDYTTLSDDDIEKYHAAWRGQRLQKSYDESKHPRVPAGNPNGGEFAVADGVGAATTDNIEFTADSTVAQRARQRGFLSAALIFRPSTGALIADDRAEHADLISEDGGHTDEYVRARALYARDRGWMFDFNFYFAGAPVRDPYSDAWETDNELATANIVAAARRLVEAGFPLDSKVRVQRASATDILNFTLGEITAKSVAFLRLAKAFGRYDESKHPRHPKGSKQGGKFAPKANRDAPAGWNASRKNPYVGGAPSSGDASNEKFKLTPEDLSELPETRRRLANVVGDDPDGQAVLLSALSETKNQKPGVYYRVEIPKYSEEDLGFGAGVGRGLYLGKDVDAVREMYGLDGGTLETYYGFPKWLDLADYDAYDKFERDAIAKYGKMELNDHLRKATLAQGYDGIRYYDPEASGEEFVLYKTDRLKKTGTKKLKPAM